MEFNLCKIAEVPKQLLDQFTCGDDDLDSFLRTEALDFAQHGITNTIVAFVEGFQAPAAFISLSTDSVRLASIEEVDLGLPFECNFKSFPAIKITKLATHSKLQSSGIGAKLLRLMEALVFESPAAARLLTVNAVNRDRTLQFYRRAGFIMSVDAENAVRQYESDKAAQENGAGHRQRRGRARAGGASGSPQPPATLLMMRDVFIGAADTFPTSEPETYTDLEEQPNPRDIAVMFEGASRSGLPRSDTPPVGTS